MRVRKEGETGYGAGTAGQEKHKERYAPPVGGLERSRELRSGGGGGVRVWGVCWAMRSCSGSASVDARSKLLS